MRPVLDQLLADQVPLGIDRVHDREEACVPQQDVAVRGVDPQVPPGEGIGEGDGAVGIDHSGFAEGVPARTVHVHHLEVCHVGQGAHDVGFALKGSVPGLVEGDLERVRPPNHGVHREPALIDIGQGDIDLGVNHLVVDSIGRWRQCHQRERDHRKRGGDASQDHVRPLNDARDVNPLYGVTVLA